MKREQVSEGEIIEAFKALEAKLDLRLIQKSSQTFVSRHEILGMITEEYTELIEAVHGGDRIRIREELLDVAVGAVFSIACLKHLDW